MYQENIIRLIDALTKYLETASGNGKTWVEVVFASPALVAAIGALAAILPVYFTNRKSRKDKEKERIQKELKEFYIPLQYMLKRQKVIAKMFKKSIQEQINEQSEQGKQEEEIRTLELLLENYTFSPEDERHLNEIMLVGEEIKKLVEENPGYISAELMDSLVELIQHYDVLRLAKTGQLSNREEYKKYVFPRKIDDMVNKTVEDLNKKLGKGQS